MTAPAFLAPRSLAEALAVLHDLGAAATVLAGGQDVVPLMNQGRLTPVSLVDISRLRELRGIVVDGVTTIGALSTHAELLRHEMIRNRWPLLADAVAQMGGGTQVRNRATIGGVICAGNPAYDLPACLIALDAVFILAGTDGVRRVHAAAFFLDSGGTARRNDELLTAVEIPPPPAGARSAYLKLKFTDGGYTIAGAACVLAMAGDGTCREARLSLSGVSHAPARLPQAEALLVGRRVDDEALATLAARVEETIADPITDVMAGGEYRRAMAGVMARRAAALAAGR